MSAIMNNKITKLDVLEAIATLIPDEAEVNVDEKTVTATDIRNYIETTIAQINDKAEKAKSRAREKKTAGDELRAAVEAVLTDEYQTIGDITAKVEGEDVTRSKVTARLTQLIRAGAAHKTKIKVDGKELVAYAVGPEPESEE